MSLPTPSLLSPATLLQILESNKNKVSEYQKTLNDETKTINALNVAVENRLKKQLETINKFLSLASSPDHQLEALRAQVKRQQVVIDKIANKLKECNESVTRYEKLVESSSGSSTLGSTCADE